MLDQLLAGGSLVLLAGALALLAWWGGVLGAWFDVSVRFNLEAYGDDSRPAADILLDAGYLIATSWHWYTAFSVGGYVLSSEPKARNASNLLLLVLLVTLVSYLVQGKGFGYHLGPLFPIYALLIAALFGRAGAELQRRPGSSWRVALSTLVILVGLGGLAKKTAGTLGPQIAWYAGRITSQELLANYSSGEPCVTLADMVEVSDYVREHTRRDESVLPLAFGTTINYLAERRFPLRFSSPALLGFVTEPYDLTAEWNAEVHAQFAAAPPAVVILYPIAGPTCAAPNRGNEPYAWIPEDPKVVSPSRLILGYVQTRYRLERTVGRAEIYRLSPG